MSETRNTSAMMYPLEEPNGWHLKAVEHLHTSEGTHWVPQQTEGGSWLVTFRKNIRDSPAIHARGHTLQEAWSNAYSVVEAIERG